MGGEKNAVQYAVSECSLGTAPGALSLSTDHGVIYYTPDFPLMNANDHTPIKNIPMYGLCRKDPTKPIPCYPVTPRVWENVNKKHLIEGAPALMKESILNCKVGGTISIIKAQP